MMFRSVTCHFRRARNGQEYARLDRERDVTDRLDVLLAEAVMLADVFEFYDCHPVYSRRQDVKRISPCQPYQETVDAS